MNCSRSWCWRSSSPSTPWWWPFSVAALVACTPTSQAVTVAATPTPTAAPNPSPSPVTPRRASRSRPLIPTLLLRIRSCESGPDGYATHGWALDANYTETNPTSSASGAWQFLDSTWHYVTGLRGRAKDYSPAVQDAAALKLYNSEGTRPWNASRDCWGRR